MCVFCQELFKNIFTKVKCPPRNEFVIMIKIEFQYDFFQKTIDFSHCK